MREDSADPCMTLSERSNHGDDSSDKKPPEPFGSTSAGVDEDLCSFVNLAGDLFKQKTGVELKSGIEGQRFDLSGNGVSNEATDLRPSCWKKGTSATGLLFGSPGVQKGVAYFKHQTTPQPKLVEGQFIINIDSNLYKECASRCFFIVLFQGVG
ncbi:uncharacterized protein LOC110006928 [Amborella trichopoda]|uniref:uncharacterized protein LOC110006928 n=1 Tax=Amborella trichopoda TaxID=13333 RepID=UPI0009C01F21|nr:uncharacterized protein LOC110006928 [Amborella trichopoda]|eukprot:XP_020520690.1 uncharacterized protein LOC110006928 [Amborella trichopoda]